MKKALTLSAGVLVLTFAQGILADNPPTSSSTTTTTTNGTIPNSTVPNNTNYFGPATYPTNPGTPGQVDDMDQVFKDNNK